jgi:hypothetical protein
MGTVLCYVCLDCGRERRFRGEDVSAALREVDAAGWHDEPDPTGPGVIARCPECAAAREARLEAGESAGGR